MLRRVGQYRIMVHMTRRDRLVTKAIALATMTVEQLATKLEVSTESLRKYRQGTRGVSPTLLTKLATQLRRHAKALDAMADRLDDEAHSGKED